MTGQSPWQLMASCLRFAMVTGVLLSSLAFTRNLSAEESAPKKSAKEESAKEEPENSERFPWLSGTLDSRLHVRTSSSDSDVYLEQILRFRVDFKDNKKIHLRGGFWAVEDLDGHEDANSTLRGIKDAFGASAQVRPLSLYVQFDDLWGDSVLRVGRQRVMESPFYTRVDGVFFSQRMENTEWYGFAGARASLYRDARNDRVAGAGITRRLSKKTRISLDAFYGRDYRRTGKQVTPGPLRGLFNSEFPRRVKGEIDSRTVALSVYHRLTDRHQLFGRYTINDSVGDEILITSTGFFGKREYVYDLTYRKRLNELVDRANGSTGFYRVLGVGNEYDELQAALHIPIAPKYTLSIEGQIRNTSGDGPNTANRDFYRLATVLAAEDVFKHLSGNISLARWEVDGGEGSWAVTGEVKKKWDWGDVRFGVDYELYEDRLIRFRPELYYGYQLFAFLTPGVFLGSNSLVSLLDTESVLTHENIYSTYIKGTYALDDRQDVSLRIFYQQDDGLDSPYWQFEAGYALRF